MPRDLEELMRCKRMQRFPATLQRQSPRPGPHDEDSVRRKKAHRFPQEACRIPCSLDAVKQGDETKCPERQSAGLETLNASESTRLHTLGAFRQERAT